MADDGKAGAEGGSPKTFTQQEVEQHTAGLVAKRDELLGEVRKLKDALKPWEGMEPEKVRALITAQEKAEADRQKEQGDWDSREKTLREQYAAEHGKIVTPLQGRVTELETELFEAVAVRDALEAMNLPTVKGNSKLLLPLVKSDLGTVVVEGKRVTVVKGPDGKPRYHPTTNALVTVEDRLKELRAIPDYAGAFEGSPGSGSGARGSGPATDGMVTLTREQASDHQQYQAALQKVGGDHSKVKVATAA